METDIRIGNIEAEMKQIKDDLLKALVELKEGLFADTFAAPHPADITGRAPDVTVTSSRDTAPADMSPPSSPEGLDQGSEFAASEENEGDIPACLNTPDRCDGQGDGETDRHLTDSQENTVSLAKIRDFANWAVATSAELGYERTLTLLEISAMMGYMPDALKSAIEKCVPRSGPGTVYTRNMAGYQMKALKTLGSLLEKKRATDIVMLQIAAQVLSSYSWPDPDGAPVEN